jgi:nudix-type nucleoside diphosphatase (YffH/AdpP family)
MSDIMHRVLIRSATVVYSGWSRLTKYLVSVDGGPDFEREVHDHGDGASVLPYDAGRKCVLLIRQFRLPFHLATGEIMMIEACAGLLDGETPEICIKREAIEEIGTRIETLESVGRVFLSPSSLTECVWLYLAPYSAADRIAGGGGKASESEIIEVIEMPVEEAWKKLDAGDICDGKTVILLQALRAKWRNL